MIHEDQQLEELNRINPAEACSRVSRMADGLIGSEILKIATEIRKMISDGHQVCNLTVGDFNPSLFPIPPRLEEGIHNALRSGETNYPPSDGVPTLRTAVLDFYRRWLELDYPLDSILITAGSRPGIYATYRTLVTPGDRVIYPVPSWNNNHYCHLVGACGVPVACSQEDAFLPTASLLRDVVRDARLLVLNSPLNPTGTAFDEEALGDICDLVLEENARRAGKERPLYLLYDQVYWMLTFGAIRHVNPVSLRPEMSDYTVLIDGISKSFAATGVRVGWTLAPADITTRMASILGHIGAWAPRAEQLATAHLLSDDDHVREFNRTMKQGMQARLDALHAGISSMQSEGLPVEAIPPMGAIYLSVRFALNGKQIRGGKTIATNEDIRRYLLEEAGMAVVPFQAFGMEDESGWFRLSVGAVTVDAIESMLPRLKVALQGVG